jgi:hypothetical protein
VHEILETATKVGEAGQKSGQRMKVTKRRQTDEEADHLAGEFVKRLGNELTEWLKLYDVQKMDEQIQEFAAKIAHGKSGSISF